MPEGASASLQEKGNFVEAYWSHGCFSSWVSFSLRGWSNEHLLIRAVHQKLWLFLCKTSIISLTSYGFVDGIGNNMTDTLRYIKYIVLAIISFNIMAHLGLKLIMQKWSYSIEVFVINLFEWLVGCSIGVMVFSLHWIVANCNIIYFMVLETPCLKIWSYFPW